MHLSEKVRIQSLLDAAGMHGQTHVLAAARSEGHQRRWASGPHKKPRHTGKQPSQTQCNIPARPPSSNTSHRHRDALITFPSRSSLNRPPTMPPYTQYKRPTYTVALQPAEIQVRPLYHSPLLPSRNTQAGRCTGNTRWATSQIARSVVPEWVCRCRGSSAGPSAPHAVAHTRLHSGSRFAEAPPHLGRTPCSRT